MVPDMLFFDIVPRCLFFTGVRQGATSGIQPRQKIILPPTLRLPRFVSAFAFRLPPAMRYVSGIEFMISLRLRGKGSSGRSTFAGARAKRR